MAFTFDSLQRAPLVRIGQASSSGDAVLTTTYQDDYIVRGNAFQIQKRISLASGATEHLVVDFSGIGSKVVFSLPLALTTTAGLVFLDTFIATSYTGGSVVDILNPNDLSTNESLSVAKIGITPTGSAHVREYAIGSKATNQSSGGSVILAQTPKLWGASRLVFKLVNQESAANVVTFGFTWYELTI